MIDEPPNGGLITLSRFLSFAICLLIVYYGLVVPVYNVSIHPLCKYPGPKLWAASTLPWTLMFLSGTTHRKLKELHDEYGPIVRIAPDELSYIDADAWDDIMGRPLSDRRDKNAKAPWYLHPDSKDILGASYEDHTRMRRLMSNGFSTKAMQEQQTLIISGIDLLIKRLHEKCKGGQSCVDLRDWYNYATFDIIGELAFGEPFGCLRESAMHPWISLICSNIKLTAYLLVFKRMPIFWLLSPFILSMKIVRQFLEHKRASRTKITRRLADQRARPDFIQHMIAEKDGLTMSYDEIVNNAVVLTLAGSETTATALTGATFFLGNNPRVVSKLYTELEEAFEDETEIDLVSVAKLPYLCAVTEEALRCYPPGPNSQPRMTPPGGNMILQRWVPGNTIIGIPHMAMYMSKDNFYQPDQFLPERWLSENRSSSFAKDRKDCFHPFSYGPRNCIGMNLAYAEFRLILARIVLNFHIEIADKSKGWLDEQKSYLLWDKPPLFVHLNPRPARQKS